MATDPRIQKMREQVWEQALGDINPEPYFSSTWGAAFEAYTMWHQSGTVREIILANGGENVTWDQYKNIIRFDLKNQ